MLGWINVHRGRDSAGLTLDWSRSHAVSPSPLHRGEGDTTGVELGTMSECDNFIIAHHNGY